MRTYSLGLIVIAALAAACSSDDDSSSGGGGTTGFGGSSGTGGFVTTGGSTATGGASTGGASSGGTSSGGTSSGGTAGASGGSAGASGGSAGASGAGGSAGASGASGASGSGGAATGGTGGVATGGTAGTGGVATGGTAGTGGVATGGTGGVATGGTGGVATGGTGGVATGGTGGTGGCPSSPILINELVPNPPSGDSGKEWVELYNPNNCAVPIAGWSLERATSTYSTMFTLPNGASIGALGYVVIGGKDVAFAKYKKQTAMNMGNASGSADAVRLVNSTNAVVDTVIYGTPNSDGFKDDTGATATSLAPTPTSSQALARSPNGTDTDQCGADFIATHTLTPNATN